MHEQRSERALVKSREMDGAHGAAVLRERFGGRASLRGDEVANRAAAEVGFACPPGKLGIHARSLASAVRGYDGEELVARAGNEKLKLAVLVHRAERTEGS